MLSTIFWIAVGIVIGKELLPQSTIAANLYSKARATVVGWFNG